MKKLYYTLTAIFVFSCSLEKKNVYEAEETVTDFYAWYLDGYYNNDKNIELSFVNNNGITTLDTSVYFNKIRESGFFSEKYIENRKIQIEPCIKLVNKLPPEEVKNYDGNPAELIKGLECNFLFYYNFLFHQGEGVDDIRIKTLILNPKKKNEVTFIIEQLFEKKPNGFQLKIILEKEGKWRIVNILSAN